jgi:head-tail adaptor
MWLTPKLSRRIDILKAIQTENENGGFDITYETLLTVWAGVASVKTGMLKYIEAIRGETISQTETHEFIVRKSAVWNIGKEVASAFSVAFKNMGDIAPLKGDMFIFMKEGSTVRGRLFQIRSILRDEERNEFLKFRCIELEEHGTGYPI